LDLQAQLEVSIDYPEYESTDRSEVVKSLKAIRGGVEALLSAAADAEPLAQGIKTAILGRPNVGKSSLLNALLEEDRAIVTEIPGATRDVLSERMRVGQLLLKLMDTAGIRSSDDQLERMGVERSVKAAQSADLAIWVLDSSQALSPDDEDVLSLVSGKKAIAVLNKSDLAPALTAQEVSDRFNMPSVAVSAKFGQGLAELRQLITGMFQPCDAAGSDAVANLRQKKAAEEALKSVESALKAAESGLYDDIISLELSAAYGSLGAIIGETVDTDLVDKIFASFCVGK
jgi:tRNA modification GTPase